MSAKNGENKICTICGKEYYVRANRVKNSKFCSKQCWEKRGDKKIKSICICCGKETFDYKKRKYCSRECSHKDMVKEKHPLWKDGKSLERDRARESTNLKKWRMEVFKRDNFTCQKCGSKKDLQAHHLKEWSKFGDLRFDIHNGLTVCIGCHGEIHNRDFTKRNNKSCIDCGKKTKLPKSYCHSCSAKRQWAKRKQLDEKYTQIIIDRMKKLDSELEIIKVN